MVLRRRLRVHHHPFAVNLTQGVADVRVRLVAVGGVPEVHAEVEATEQDARRFLVREVVLQHGHQARTPTEARHRDAGRPVGDAGGQGDEVRDFQVADRGGCGRDHRVGLQGAVAWFPSPTRTGAREDIATSLSPTDTAVGHRRAD